MSTLRISDAPLLPDVSGAEKIPTGGRGDYAVSIDQIKTFTQGGLPQQIEDHINDLENPHNVNKNQVGLGNADNTSDIDKPISIATQEALYLKADKTFVDEALSSLSTQASKFYPTLAEANADIANLAVNQSVQVGEVANGGLWYKATAEATSLTKSAYDPLMQAKSYADGVVALSRSYTKAFPVGGVSGSEISVTTDDLKYPYFAISGVASQDITLVLPKLNTGYWFTRNYTTGSNIYIKVEDQVTPVLLKKGGAPQIIFSDGVQAFAVYSEFYSSPEFVGIPKAPTALLSTATTQIATTQFVKTAVDVSYNSTSTIDLNELSGDVVLTESQVNAAYLNLTGALSNNVTLIFPSGYRRNWAVRNNTSGFDVYVRGASQVVAANKLVRNSAVTMQTLYSNGFVVMTSEAKGSNPTPQPTETSYRGLFKFGDDYAIGDIVEHGSGTYVVAEAVTNADTAPHRSVSYVKQSHNARAGLFAELKAKNVTYIPDQGVEMFPEWMSKDGRYCYNAKNNKLQRSKDSGATWETIYTLTTTHWVQWVRELNNGELLFMIRDSTVSQQKIYRTVGYNWGDGTISSVVQTEIDLTKPLMTVSGSWSVDVYKHIVLVAQYGPKSGVAWGGGTALPGENARYLYMSLDHGVTWQVILDLNAVVGTDSVHLHGVCYDPYWQRIWVTSGDGAWSQTTTMYSDDLGATWKFAHRFIKGEGGNPDSNTATDGYRHQNVNIVALPTCILFATDGYPDGIQRIDRAQGKHTADGLYEIEIAHYVDNGQTSGAYICAGVSKTDLPDAPYLFAFAPEFQSSKNCVIATYDGWNFSEVWRDNLTLPQGQGLLAISGITQKNQIILKSTDTRSSNLEIKTKIVIDV